MRKVEGYVRNAVGRPEVLRGADAWPIMLRWSEIVGEALAERSQPDRYDRGTVWVAVTGAEWAQELRLMKEPILRRLNDLAEDVRVRTIRLGAPRRTKPLFVDVRFGIRKPRPRPEMEPHSEPVEKAEEPDWREGLSILEIARRRMESPSPDGTDGPSKGG